MSKEEKNTYTIKTDENLGEIKIADEVVAIIAGLAAMEVEGVASMAGNATRELISKLGMNGYCMGIDKHQYKKEIYEKFRDFFASDKAWIECNITKPEPVYSLEKLPIK